MVFAAPAPAAAAAADSNLMSAYVLQHGAAAASMMLGSSVLGLPSRRRHGDANCGGVRLVRRC